MRRLLPLFAAVLALAVSGTASADTFKVVRSHSGGPAPLAFSTGEGAIPFTQGQNGPNSFTTLRSIWQAAGSKYGIPWGVLAAINKVETDFGRNLGPSSAGAVGWMQFMPSTWARWGIDANGDGVADPNNPTDAIFSAARYLAGCGGQFDISGAIYCYNHASWYVSEVLGLAAQYERGGGSGLVPVDQAQLQSRLDAISARIRTANKQLVAAVARARVVAHAARRLLHSAADAKLLSDQLEAHKRAVLMSVRYSAAERRVTRLRNLLHSATAQLSRAQAQTSSMPFPGTSAWTSGLQFERIDQGVDYVSSRPYQALAAGTVVYIDPNFWQGTPAVYEKLDTPVTVNGRTYDEIFYSETQALVHLGQRVVPGQAVIGPGAAELGFAQGNLPAAHAVYHEGDQTTAGHDFFSYVSAGSPGGGSSPTRFFLVSSPVSGLQQTGGTAFTSNVVYFTR